jgi:DNA-binding XRE family transcriptional regulator
MWFALRGLAKETSFTIELAMPIGHLLIDGRRFMVIDESEYSRLLSASAGAPLVAEADLPPLPKPAADGTVPALEFSRASLARKIIIERTARGWSQAELARRAGIRVETISRLENAKNNADVTTCKKIQTAFDAHETANARSMRVAGNTRSKRRAG